MKYLKERLFAKNMKRYLCKFVKDENFWKTIEKYKKIGFKVHYDRDENALIVITRKFIYSIRIFKIKGKIYWKLRPYNNSYFLTELSKNKCNIDIVLFAIKEHEQLYMGKES